MSLIVIFQNDGTGRGEIGHYNITVKINDRVIHTDRVVHHWRGDGWEILVKKFADKLKKEKDR